MYTSRLYYDVEVNTDSRGFILVCVCACVHKIFKRYRNLFNLRQIVCALFMLTSKNYFWFQHFRPRFEKIYTFMDKVTFSLWQSTTPWEHAGGRRKTHMHPIPSHEMGKWFVSFIFCGRIPWYPKDWSLNRPYT